MDKLDQYTRKLYAHIAEIFNEDCENHISPDDFDDDKNSTAFFHALATVMPSLLYAKLTDQEVDVLGFNHIANRICFTMTKIEQ